MSNLKAIITTLSFSLFILLGLNAEANCNINIVNNTSCTIDIEWWNGFNLIPGGSLGPNATQNFPVITGNTWRALNSLDGSLVSGWNYAPCNTSTFVIPASACTVPQQATSDCNFTITNNTSCTIVVKWWDGFSVTTGATIAPFSSAVEPMDDPSAWRTENAQDGSSVTAWAWAECSSPSGTISSAACSAAPVSNNCNYTIKNNTACTVEIHWYDGSGYYIGATIPPSSTAVEPIIDGSQWLARNANDGTFISQWAFAYCSVPDAVLDASFCGAIGKRLSFENNSVNVYPNPASNSITIESPANEELSAVKIFDLTGAIVKQAVYSQKTSSYDISDLNNGIYIIHVFSDNRTYTEKLIVKK